MVFYTATFSAKIQHFFLNSLFTSSFRFAQKYLLLPCVGFRNWPFLWNQNIFPEKRARNFCAKIICNSSLLQAGYNLSYILQAAWEKCSVKALALLIPCTCVNDCRATWLLSRLENHKTYRKVHNNFFFFFTIFLRSTFQCLSDKAN